MVHGERSMLVVVTMPQGPSTLRAPQGLGGMAMSKAEDTIENPVTGEWIVVRVGTEDSGGELLAVDGYVRP